jgi:hypothetical protein
MTGYETFEIYQALKLHFTSKDYNFFTYNGKINTSITAFENRKDKYHFYKLSRKFTNKNDLINFLIANFLEDDKVWIGKLLESESETIYLKQQKVIQSLSYIFENDCRTLFEGQNPNDVLKVTNGEHPILLQKTRQKITHFETFCVLNKILNFIPSWSNKITDTIIWPDYRRKTLKYTAFLPSDIVKYKLILKKVIS